MASPLRAIGVKMTLLNLILGRSDMQSARMKRVRQEGSPPYVWTPGSIAAGGSLSIYLDTQFPDSRKYSPLDWIEIANGDEVDLTITINTDETRLVPARVIRIVDDDIGIRHVKVTNNHASTATTANRIVLTFQRKAITIDTLARRLSQ